MVSSISVSPDLKPCAPHDPFWSLNFMLYEKDYGLDCKAFCCFNHGPKLLCEWSSGLNSFRQVFEVKLGRVRSKSGWVT